MFVTLRLAWLAAALFSQLRWYAPRRLLSRKRATVPGTAGAETRLRAPRRVRVYDLPAEYRRHAAGATQFSEVKINGTNFL